VSKILASKYLPLAKNNLKPGEQESFVQDFSGNDELGSGVNDARLRNALNATQQGSYDWVRKRAENYSSRLSPANAVDQALRDYRKEFPDQFKNPAQSNNQKPSFDQWKAEIKKKGSKLSDQQLDAYYRQNYGR
jgi:hypothetical protein